MNYYLKFLWIAVFCGILCMLGYSAGEDKFFSSEVISLFGMYGTSYFVQYLPDITHLFVPLLLFQMFFGTYIYHHFCTASIYFFSRYPKRNKWFFTETFKLYLFGCIYLFLMLISGTLVCSLFSKIVIDRKMWKLLFFYICIYSLYLFVSTFAINLLSILFNSNVAFIIVAGINSFFIAAFTIVGNFFAPEGVILQQYEWTIKINPFYYLIFGMHNNNTDYFISILLFFSMAVLLFICSYFVINKHDFIDSNRETGGV